MKARRGNCWIMLLLLAGGLIAGIYFLLQTNSSVEKPPALKPVITSFAKEISGTWRAKLVKINPPPGRRQGYKPPWMQDNPRDFAATVEIGKDFHIKRATWVEICKSHAEIRAEWTSPDKWKYSMRNSYGQSGQERGESKRHGDSLTLSFQGANGTVRECTFDIGGVPAVPDKFRLDGGFREGKTGPDIEAEIVLFAPEITNAKFAPGNLQIQVNPFGFEFKKSRFEGLDERLKKEFDNITGVTRFNFAQLRKLRVDSIKDIDMSELPVKGYPGLISIGLRKINARLTIGDEKGNGDRVFLEQVPGISEAFLEKAHSAHLRVKVLFSENGTGKMFTHHGEMEYELTR